MSGIWSRLASSSGRDGPDYWEHFGARLVERAAINLGTNVLDVGCGTGSSLIPAAVKTGERGHVIGIDVCPH